MPTDIRKKLNPLTPESTLPKVPGLTTTEQAELDKEDTVKARVAAPPIEPVKAPTAPKPEQSKTPIDKLRSKEEADAAGITPETEKVMVEFASQVKDPTDPRSSATVLKYISDKMDELEKKDKVWMTAQADKLKQAYAEIGEEAKRKESRVDKFALAETIGHALVQLGYAFSSMRSNTNFAGPLKFDKANWEKAYDRILDERKFALAEAKDNIDGESDVHAQASQKRREEAGQKISFVKGLYDDNVQNARTKAREIKKLDPKKAKDMLAKEQEKVRADFRAIEAYAAKYDNAKNKKEKADLLGKIYQKLKQPEDGKERSLEELAELKKGPGWAAWVKSMATWDKTPDQFKEFIQTVKDARMNALYHELDPEIIDAVNSEMDLRPKAVTQSTTEMVIMVDPETGEEGPVHPAQVEAAMARGLKRK